MLLSRVFLSHTNDEIYFFDINYVVELFNKNIIIFHTQLYFLLYI